MENKTNIDTETLEAKLRNQLSPLYGLASMVVALEDNNSPELLKIIIECAKQAMKSTEEIDIILKKIDANRRKDNPVDSSALYGKYVQIDDRFETVHIWSKELEEKNAGRWIPKEITEEEYLREKKHDWNN